MTLIDAIKAYKEQFGEGPPIWGMDDDEAVALIERALETNQPIADDAVPHVPDGVYL